MNMNEEASMPWSAPSAARLGRLVPQASPLQYQPRSHWSRSSTTYARRQMPSCLGLGSFKGSTSLGWFLGHAKAAASAARQAKRMARTTWSKAFQARFAQGWAPGQVRHHSPNDSKLPHSDRKHGTSAASHLLGVALWLPGHVLPGPKRRANLVQPCPNILPPNASQFVLV